MTIVASNSLTISNVNDGTITHYAYAYSADGTDRFTTVYPNLNLLNFNSGLILGKYPDWATGMIIMDNVQRATFDYVPVMPNAKYTLSANWAAGTALSLFGFNSKTDSSATTTFSGVSNRWISLSTRGQFISKNTTITIPDRINFIRISWISAETLTLQNLLDAKPKLELGSTATPWMPSASEVTTADWPSYIGQYSDFTQADSTNPSDYTWSRIRGNDGKDGATGNDGIAGKDGVGINTTTITYAGSTSGTIAPAGGWTATVPTVAAGSYLWTKTVWTYTDNSSETGYSVGKMGNNGAPGSNGDPGKIVSDTEPTTRFKGLTWKYSGTADLTASDGTVIKPNTEYYYNGTHWMINYLSANNIEANSITADLIDAKNLTITDGEFVSTIIDGAVQTQTEIKDDHLLIYKMDTSTNSINTIALKSDSGLSMTYQNSDTGEYTSAGINFQGLFMQNNITGTFARLTPYGVFVSNGLQTTTVSLGSGINATLAKIGQMCQISINSNSSNVPAGNGVTLSGNIPAGWRPAIGTPFEVMMYSGTAFQRPLHITIGTDGKLSIVNASASSYWCFGGTVYMLA
jgi:hypothetical protein